MNTTTKVKKVKIGDNELLEQFYGLSKFVKANFRGLYEGAVKLGVNISEDSWAPRRIQINDTRLHEGIGLKYAAGYKYDCDYYPSEERLIETVRDINLLIDAAKKEVKSKIIISYK